MNPLAWFLFGFYALAALWGVRLALPLNESPAEVLYQLGLAFCLAIWAVGDASRRQKPISRFQQNWFLILSGIVVPCYVIATRGWKGVAWVVLHGVGWLVIAILAMHAAGAAYYGDAWWQAAIP